MSDIVVVPSIQEAFGLSVTEAMACGKPVIGTRVGGIPDQITEGQNGLLVEPRNPSALAQAILRLAEDRSLRLRMGVDGRKTVEKQFDLAKRVRAITAFYEELLP